MTITYTVGPVLSTETWANLADEYLGAGTDEPTSTAGRNAADLAAYVAREVNVDLDGRLSVGNGPLFWVPVEDDTPYLAFAEMRLAWRTGAVLQVSDLHHDHPVFSRLDNLRFRVWHDTEHLVTNVGFEPDDEVVVFIHSARRILDETNNQRLVDALFCESIYQLSAFVATGSYPDQQYVRTPGPAARALLDSWGLRAR